MTCRFKQISLCIVFKLSMLCNSDFNSIGQLLVLFGMGRVHTASGKAFKLSSR